MSEGNQVRIYTTRFCPFCVRARQLLNKKAVAFDDIAVDGDRAQRARLAEATGQRTVPQIFIGDVHVGGFEELAALEARGRLDQLLAELRPHGEEGMQ